jgi:hypothetical protein
MTILSESDTALLVAHTLVEFGVPVFAARLKSDGTPDRMDKRWKGWETKAADAKAHSAIRNLQDSEALCAVTGIVFDVIDHDLQNDPGGLALRDMSEELDEDGPEVYLETLTPSGGTHLWVAAQDIGTHPGFRTGLDYKGGHVDGSSRGFVFLPPTIRPSKRDGVPRAYLYRSELSPPLTDDICQPLCDYVLAGKPDSEGVVERPGRQEVDQLRAAAVKAPAGGQRNALLRYVHELERKGYDDADIITLLKSLKLPAYNKQRPWTERDFRALLHVKGTIIADARPGELDGIESVKRVSPDSARWLNTVTMEELRWLAAPLFPFGCLVIIDGDPGIGKSLLTLNMICRATQGEGMFPGDEGIGEAINCALVGAEDDLASVVVPRVVANGGDLNRIATMPLKRKRGVIEQLTFPDGVNRLEAMIRASNAQLCTIDPISSFLGEDISSHNEASVRRALGPVVEVAQRTQCCIVLVRHLNKDNTMKAIYRGGGSIAFSGIARSGLIAGALPDGSGFGIAHVKSSNEYRLEGSLAYAIDRQSVQIPGSGKVEMPVIRWIGPSEFTAEDIAKGEDGRHAGNGGRKPIQQELVEEALMQLIEEYGGEPIPAGEALAYLKSDGCSTSPTVLAKARDTVGLRSIPMKDGKGKMVGWAWLYG